MHVPFPRVAARSFWIAAGLICFGTMGAPSASAQAPCVLSLDVVRSLASGANNLVQVSGGSPGTSTGNGAPGSGLLDGNAALELLTDIVRTADAAGDAALTNLGTVEQNLVDTLCNTVQSLGVQSTVA